MKLTHIVACAENGTIGRDGTMPWHLPQDLKFFKKITSGHIIIMGRKTHESIGKPLPNRYTVVVTRQKDYQPEGVAVVNSLDEAYGHCTDLMEEWGNEVFIVGGAEIYKQTLDRVDTIYMTLIHREVKGDTFYPMHAIKEFEAISEESHSEPESFSFQTLKRNA